MFNVFCKENKRYGWVFTFKAKFWHDFWDNMIMYRTYLIHVCVLSTSHAFNYTCCKSKSSIWFIIFLSFTQYFIFYIFFFLCLKSIFYRFPILVYPSFCMFAILHIWCLMFYDFVTYLHLSLHVSLHFHHLFVYKTSYLKFFLKKQFWQGMKRGCLFQANKTCSFFCIKWHVKVSIYILFLHWKKVFEVRCQEIWHKSIKNKKTIFHRISTFSEHL